MKAKRQLAAILFADIVGYTSTMQADEDLALIKLNRFKKILENKSIQYQGEIIQYYGDGCLMIFNNSSDAVHLAIDAQMEFKLEPKVTVRIGIHLGDVVLKEGNVFGNAVNIASRVESMGIPGAVLISSSIKNQIKNRPEFELTLLGRFEFKNVEGKMSVYAVANEGLAIPDKKRITGKFKPNTAKPKFNLTRTQAILLVTLLILFISAIWFSQSDFLRESSESNKGNSIENSIAVLPFESISQEEENKIFAIGIHDDLLSQISAIKEVKVISKTSVVHYKQTTKRLPEIAAELGVNFILEGSVQRYADKIRLNVNLVNGKTDTQLWSNVYTRPFSLEDIFTIQSEIVRDIANTLQLTLVSGVGSYQRKAPTTNTEAYKWYVKATEVWNDRSPEGISRAIEYFNNAIERDSNFAVGYAGLAQALSLCDDYKCTVHYSDIRDDAIKLAEKALELDANLAEAWVALAGALKFISRDIDHKKTILGYYEKAMELNPNYALAYHWQGMNYTRLGWNKQALQLFEKGHELNPYSTSLTNMLSEQLTKNGRYEEAIELFKKTHIPWINDQEFYAENWPAFTAYIKLGEVDKARKIGEDKIQEDYRRNLFEVLLLAQIGEAEQARDLLEKTKLKNPVEEKIFLGLNYDWAEYRVLDAEDRIDDLFAHINKAFEENKWWVYDIPRYPPALAVKADDRYEEILLKLDLLIEELPQ